MRYEGRAQLGDDDQAVEVVVQIPDVEHPEWFGLIVEGSPPLARGEVSVTLLDGGIYNAWRGSAIVSAGSDAQVRLAGHVPMTPPIGA